jgi:hypothetical protein
MGLAQYPKRNRMRLFGGSRRVSEIPSGEDATIQPQHLALAHGAQSADQAAWELISSVTAVLSLASQEVKHAQGWAPARQRGDPPLYPFVPDARHRRSFPRASKVRIRHPTTAAAEGLRLESLRTKSGAELDRAKQNSLPHDSTPTTLVRTLVLRICGREVLRWRCAALRCALPMVL